MSAVGKLKRQDASSNLNSGMPNAAGAADQLKDPLSNPAPPVPQQVVAAPAPTLNKASTLTLASAYSDYADAFDNFCRKEAYCGESSEFLRSVDAGRDAKTIYNRFIKAGGSKEINIPGALRLPYDEQAKKNQYDRMDFSAARAEIWAMLERDLPRRFGDSKFLKAAVGP